jgi:hypothetical protein
MMLLHLLRALLPKNWTCMCGYSNSDNRTTCAGCGR